MAGTPLHPTEPQACRCRQAGRKGRLSEPVAVLIVAVPCVHSHAGLISSGGTSSALLAVELLKCTLACGVVFCSGLGL
jgi:hypothetical protein